MNNLFNGFINKEVTIYNDNEIGLKNNKNENLEDILLYHPFIDDLQDQLNNKELSQLIIYRLNKHNEFNYVEYYNTNIICFQNSDIILDKLKHISGKKKVKGSIRNEIDNYTIVQIRDNKINENWITLWDIIINNHYYGEKIDETLYKFILKYSKLDDLFIKDIICKKPQILYCLVNEKYKNYINTHNSIQYCQNEKNLLIHLSKFKSGFNVRNICFLDDSEINEDLLNNDYIVERKEEEYEWIVKNDKNIISFLK